MPLGEVRFKFRAYDMILNSNAEVCQLLCSIIALLCLISGMTDVNDTPAVPRAAAKGLVPAQPSSAASTRPGKCVCNEYQRVSEWLGRPGTKSELRLARTGKETWKQGAWGPADDLSLCHKIAHFQIKSEVFVEVNMCSHSTKSVLSLA
jgi:hypothetical protein